MIALAGSGHIGGALGAAEIFAVLYRDILRLDSERAVSIDVNHDRFILSNGHICAAWYAVLARTGYLPLAELATHRRLGSRLQGHPSRAKWPEAVEYSSGPLGQGLSVANGLAMALRMRGGTGRVFCLVGDGEMEEGQIWEAIHSAGHHNLGNVVLLVAWNDVQIDGFVHNVKGLDPLKPKLEAFGWRVMEVDGHDTESLRSTLTSERGEVTNGYGMPRAIIAKTVLGKGVSFMENRPAWHGSPVTRKQAMAALAEIGSCDGFDDFPTPGGEL